MPLVGDRYTIQAQVAVFGGFSLMLTDGHTDGHMDGQTLL